MRYILQPSFKNELEGRQKYLFLVFNLYFIQVPGIFNDSIELESFPFEQDNILILYGHNYWIRSFFHEFGRQIKNKTKIVNSCDWMDSRKVFAGQKDLYFNKTQNGSLICYSGKEFNLPFDVSQSELELLNLKSLTFKEKVQFAYRKVS